MVCVIVFDEKLASSGRNRLSFIFDERQMQLGVP
jgi:hypothetical protein